MTLRTYRLMVDGKAPLLGVPSAADDSDDEKETVRVEKKAEPTKEPVTKTTQPPQHTAQAQLILKQFQDQLSEQERKLVELMAESTELASISAVHLKHIELNSYYFSKNRPASREAARQEMKDEKLYGSYASFSQCVDKMVLLYKDIDAYLATPKRLLDAKFQASLSKFKSSYEKFKGKQASQHEKFVKYNEKVKEILAVVVSQEEPVVVADLIATAAVEEAPKQLVMA
jgi:hypothetical protein